MDEWLDNWVDELMKNWTEEAIVKKRNKFLYLIIHGMAAVRAPVWSRFPRAWEN